MINGTVQIQPEELRGRVANLGRYARN